MLDWRHSMTFELYDHQKKTIDFILEHNGRVCVMSDPGTGKTASVLLALDEMFKQGYIQRVLVLSPKSIVEAAWGEDAHTFVPHIPTAAVVGSTADKMKFLTNPYFKIVATNHDTILKLTPQVLKLFDAIVIDESTKFKNPQAAGTKALLKAGKGMKFALPMTGTPIPLTILDIWSPLRLARPDKMALFTAFRMEVCVPISVPIGNGRSIIQWSERIGIRDALTALYSDTIIRFAKEDCLDLPPQVTTTRTVKLSPALRKAYDQFANECLIEFETGVVTAVHAGSLAMKLSQLSSGFLYGDDGKHRVSPERYELATEIVSERKHSLVSFIFREQRDHMIELLKASGISYEVLDGETKDSRFGQIVDEFQRGMYQVLLCQPQSVAHGVTLTKADTIVWLSVPRSLEHWVQFNARIDRIGQKQHTEVIALQAADTYEVKAYRRLMSKNASQLDLLSLLKE
jgi:SNF2 family DNA or RNA helicase